MTRARLDDPRVDPLAILLADARRYLGYDVPDWDNLPDHRRHGFRIEAAYLVYRMDEAATILRQVYQDDVEPVRVETPAPVAEPIEATEPEGIADPGRITVVASEPMIDWRERTRLADGGGVVKPLTRRQTEIVALMVEGNDAKGIADALGISPGTVNLQLHFAYKRLGLTVASPGHRLVALYVSGQLPALKTARSAQTA